MLFESLRKINWLDIFVIILIFRICYIAFKSGFINELFKLSGTILAIYLSLHYYTSLSEALVKNSVFIRENIPVEMSDFLVFLFFACSGYLLFVLLRLAVQKWIKVEATALLNKWGGFILGLGRSLLLAGLVIFALSVSSIGYFQRSVKLSFSGPDLRKIPVGTYSSLWNGFASKFMGNEKFNNNVTDTKAF
jgi:uncharacterized membrane protein required for colicin V production